MDNLKQAIVSIAKDAFQIPAEQGRTIMINNLQYTYEVMPLSNLEFTVRVPNQHGMGGPRYFNIRVSEKW